MKRSFWELMLLLFFLTTACETPHFTIDQPAAGEVPWTKLAMDRPDDQFQFAIVTDRTGGLRPGVFAEAVDKLNLLQPQFVMSVGDLITGYTEDLPELERQWEEFDAMVDKLDMPFFYVPGNHDITNAVMAKLWTERFGPSYYHFVYKDVLFLCLNTEDQHRGAGRGTISDDQFAYIQQTLAEHEDVRWTLVFMHQPLWDQHHPTERWPEVAQLLRDRSHTVYAGHVHHYQRFSQNNGKYYTLATTGGGSGLRGPQLGEFDHVSWVTMTEDGPIMANLALDGILPEDLVTKADYDFVRRISESFPVRFELPDRYALSAAGPDTVKLQIHNTTDLPLRAQLTPRFSFDYLAELSADLVEVAPNSVESVGLVLHERPTKRTKVEVGSLPLEATLTYGLSGDQELTIPFNWRLAPLQSYLIREADAAEKLPLEQDDYLFPFQFGEAVFDTPSDCEVRWDVAVQGDELIVWAEVTDDEVVVRAGETGFRQDYLAVVVNADPLPISILRDGAAWYRESLIFLASPAEGEVPSTTFYADRYDFDIPYHCEATPDGYRFWAKFPLSYIQERQGGNWRNLRINLAVQDEDSGETEKRRASWQPNWRSAENVVGSGVFFRE